MTTEKKVRRPRKKLSEMEPWEQRVAIARDIIRQIKAGMLVLQEGRYLQFFEQDAYCRYEVNKEVLKKQKCTVCGIGAAIYGGLRLFNGKTVFTNPSNEKDAQRAVTRWFTTEQACLIEQAFELDTCRHLFPIGETTQEQRNAAWNYGHRFTESDTVRAIAIYKNIIKNKGAFIP